MGAAAAGLVAGIPGSRGPRLARAVGSLVQPPVLASRSGVLSAALEAAVGPVTVGGGVRNVTTFNQSFPGPTLLVRPGDRLVIAFTSRLVEMTNVHFHGLHVSPVGISDNVYLHVDTDETQSYRVNIPIRHAAGLDWYHPHGHTTQLQQMFAGMAGALMIQGGLDDHPAIGGLPDRLLVLQATKFDGSNTVVVLNPPAVALNGLSHFVNGQLDPTIPMQAGRRERWRLLNATVSAFYEITLAGHTFHQVAADGKPFDVPVELSALRLSPGSRAEILVEVDAVGSLPLTAKLRVGPDANVPFTLATLDVSGSGASPALPARLLPFVDLRQDPVDRQRSVHFNVSAGSTFVIDGKVFDEARVDQAVSLGAIEEWTVVNDQVAPQPVPHKFHIHTNDLMLTHVNGAAVPVHGFQDTVELPASGSLTLRMHFGEFTGPTVFHCHIILHADRGMMARLDIGGPVGAPPAQVGFSIAARGIDGGIHRNRFDAYQWVGWETLAGATSDTPALAATEGGRLDMVVRGLDDGLYHAHFDGKTWTDWLPVGGATLGRPALAAAGGRTLHLVVRGLDDAIYHAYYNGTAWLPYDALGGATLHTPVLVEHTGVVDVVARGLDDALYHTRYSGSWSPFQALGGATADVPALVHTGRGTLALVARGLDNGVYYARYDGAAWSAFEALAGATLDAPALAAHGDGTLVLVVRGLDNGIYHALHDGTAWSGFQPVGGATDQAPTLAATAGGMVDLLVQGLDGEIHHARFDGSLWSAFLTVGGAAASDLMIAAE
jgi:FtsP/CotA-like multicopper oxidase with cupredoxin domain